jgi:hypothetical protein
MQTKRAGGLRVTKMRPDDWRAVRDVLLYERRSAKVGR